MGIPGARVSSSRPGCPGFSPPGVSEDETRRHPGSLKNSRGTASSNLVAFAYGWYVGPRRVVEVVNLGWLHRAAISSEPRSSARALLVFRPVGAENLRGVCTTCWEFLSLVET